MRGRRSSSPRRTGRPDCGSDDRSVVISIPLSCADSRWPSLAVPPSQGSVARLAAEHSLQSISRPQEDWCHGQEYQRFSAARGTLSGVIQTKRDEQRRERLREYEAALTDARSPVEVLVLFAKVREDRALDERLEETFAASIAEGVDDADRLPAAVWVALRQGDVDAVIQTLVRTSSTELVLAAHEQLDAGYRLTSVEERRALPDVGRLEAQVASFLRIPYDVVAMITSWGPDDPRTAVEIDALVEQRFGSPARLAKPSRARREPSAGTTTQAGSSGPGISLSMSSEEFTALLNLTPEQRAVLMTLVRQATITIGCDL